MSGYLHHALEEFEGACAAFEAERGTPQEQEAARHRLVVFGVAALTLDAARVDRGMVRLALNIGDARDEFGWLAYMLRCPSAHDIAMPCWEIRDKKFLRSYTVGGYIVDLSPRRTRETFDFAHIGGPCNFLAIARFAQRSGWA